MLWQIYDPNVDRYEAPVPLTLPEEDNNDTTSLYDVIISPDSSMDDFFIKVVRKSTNKTM